MVDDGVSLIEFIARGGGVSSNLLPFSLRIKFPAC